MAGPHMHHSSANHCSTTKLSGLPELSVQFSGPFLQRLCSGHQSLSSLQCSPQSGAAALCIIDTRVPTKGSLLALPPADYKWKTLVYTAGVQLIQSLKRIPVYPEPSVFPRARAPYFTNPHSSYTTLY